MACKTCSTTSSKSGDSSLWQGSLTSGAVDEITYTRSSLPVDSLRVPNIVVLTDNPYLLVGDKFTLDNIGSIGGAFRGVVSCATVTAAPVQVGTKWEVATDLAMVSLTGSPTLTIASTGGGSSDGGFGCPPIGNSVGGATEKLTALICVGTLNAANFSGYIYTRRPGGIGTGFNAYVTAGSNKVTVKKRGVVQIGDRVVLANTAITETNAATVTGIATGTRENDGQPVSILTLDVNVSGVTGTPDASGLICVGAIAQPQKIADITFTVLCNCTIRREISKAVTSLPSFPPGMPYEDGEDCGRTKYCYVINDATVGSKTPYEFGYVVM